MAESIQKLLKIAKERFKKVDNKVDQTGTITLLSEKIDKLADLITMLVLQQHTENIKTSVDKIKSLNNENTSLGGDRNEQEMALDQLEEITTCQKDVKGNRTFLLHRPTVDFEYQKYEDGRFYETKDKTEWFAEYETGRALQESDNPVISCWIPEDSIDHIPTPHANTGTWGDLGENPFAHKYKVVVKSGEFEIYQTLKQQ